MATRIERRACSAVFMGFGFAGFARAPE